MSGVRVSHLGPVKADCFIESSLLLQLFATFTPNHYLPSALTISRDYLSQENSFFNVERTVLPCAHTPERYNKNSYSLRLKPTGGCLLLIESQLVYPICYKQVVACAEPKAYSNLSYSKCSVFDAETTL